jgi:hypothetical protein
MSSTKSDAEQIIDEFLPLFPDLPKVDGKRPRKYKRIDQLIWSDHKARFIQHYLRYLYRSQNTAPI